MSVARAPSAPASRRRSSPRRHHCGDSSSSSGSIVRSPAPRVRHRSPGRSSAPTAWRSSSQPGHVDDGELRVLGPDGVGDQAAGDTRDRALPGAVDVGHHQHVRLREGGPELGRQRGGPREAVGLEHRHHPGPSARPRRGQGGPHLGGEVGVVVDEGHAAGLAAELEAAGHAGEAGQGRLGRLEGRTDLERRHDGHRRVPRVVEAGDADGERAQLPVRPAQGEGHGAALQIDVVHGVGGPRVGPDGDGPVLPADGRRLGIVGADDGSPGARRPGSRRRPPAARRRCRSSRDGPARRWSARPGRAGSPGRCRNSRPPRRPAIRPSPTRRWSRSRSRPPR